jgi:hypothetical protein
MPNWQYKQKPMESWSPIMGDDSSTRPWPRSMRCAKSSTQLPAEFPSCWMEAFVSVSMSSRLSPWVPPRWALAGLCFTPWLSMDKRGSSVSSKCYSRKPKQPWLFVDARRSPISHDNMLPGIPMVHSVAGSFGRHCNSRRKQ